MLNNGANAPALGLLGHNKDIDQHMVIMMDVNDIKSLYLVNQYCHSLCRHAWVWQEKFKRNHLYVPTYKLIHVYEWILAYHTTYKKMNYVDKVMNVMKTDGIRMHLPSPDVFIDVFKDHVIGHVYTMFNHIINTTESIQCKIIQTDHYYHFYIINRSRGIGDNYNYDKTKQNKTFVRLLLYRNVSLNQYCYNNKTNVVISYSF